MRLLADTERALEISKNQQMFDSAAKLEVAPNLPGGIASPCVYLLSAWRPPPADSCLFVNQMQTLKENHALEVAALRDALAEAQGGAAVTVPQRIVTPAATPGDEETAHLRAKLAQAQVPCGGWVGGPVGGCDNTLVAADHDR